MAAQSVRSSTPGASSLDHGAPDTAFYGGRRQGNVVGFFFILLRWASAGVGLDYRRRSLLGPRLHLGSSIPGARGSPSGRLALHAGWAGTWTRGSVEFSLRVACFPQSFPFSITRSSQRFPHQSKFFQNRHYWRTAPGDSHRGESPNAGSVQKEKKILF